MRWPLSAELAGLPGSRQRRRALRVLVVAGVVWLARPWPPFQLLPGWVVGGLVLWAVLELLLWIWRPRRWR